jgi:tetratricopeptide (TPR) repeat protein
MSGTSRFTAQLSRLRLLASVVAVTLPAWTLNATASDTLTQDEISFVGRHVMRCVTVPPGSSALPPSPLRLRISVDNNGVARAVHADRGEYRRLDTQSEFVLSALQRGILDPRCNPIPLPPNRLDALMRTTFTFDDPSTPRTEAAVEQRAVTATVASSRVAVCDLLTAHPDDRQRVADPVPIAERDPVRAVPACEAALRADPNSARLRYQLGLALDTARRFTESFVAYEQAARMGHVAAGHALGWAYSSGEGVERNDAEAVRWYRWAAERGHSGSMNTLGVMIENGRGVPRDLVQAADWYRRAYGVDGRPIAAFNLARLLAAGRDGVREDRALAVQLFRVAVQAGRSDAALHLALMVERGEAPQVPPAEVIQLLALAEAWAPQRDRALRSINQQIAAGNAAAVEAARRAVAEQSSLRQRDAENARQQRERVFAQIAQPTGTVPPTGFASNVAAPSATPRSNAPSAGNTIPSANSPAPTSSSNFPPPSSSPEMLRSQYARRIGDEVARQIFIGAPGDLLLFSNESPSAPHLFRRLSGEVSFRSSRMNLCGLGNARSLDGSFGEHVESELRRRFIGVVLYPTSAPWSIICSSLQSNSENDVMAILRGDLQAHPTLQDLLAQALSDRRVRPLVTIVRAPHDQAIASYNSRAASAIRDIRNNQVRGVGLLSIQNQSDVVCSASEDNLELVRRLSARIRLGVVSGKKPSPNGIPLFGDIDDIFHQSKSGRCGFVYSDVEALVVFQSALERDARRADFVPVFISSDEVSEIRAAIEAERRSADETRIAREAEAARRAAETRQEALRQAAEAEQRRQLDVVRRRNDEAHRREELERLRSSVVSRGRALTTNLDAILKRHIDSVTAELGELRRRAQTGRVLSQQEQRVEQVRFAGERVDNLFPSWSALVQRAMQEEWEYSPMQSELEDYGQANWRGRTIEAAAVRVHFPMVNRHIGERRTDCYVFVWIQDDEFRFWRQASSFRCDASNASFTRWAETNEFRSQWRLPPQ